MSSWFSLWNKFNALNSHEIDDEYLNKQDKVIPISLGSSSLPRVLPVQIKSIKIVSSNKTKSAGGKLLPCLRI